MERISPELTQPAPAAPVCPPGLDAAPTVDVVASAEELRRWAADIDRLAAGAGTPLLNYHWLKACADAFTEGAELRVFISRDLSGIRAVAPLVEEWTRAGRCLRPLGHQLGEPDAFGYDSEPALRAMCAEICRAGLPIVLPRLDAGGGETASLRRAAQRNGTLVVRVASTQSTWAQLNGDWEGFESGMSGNSRRLIRRRLRQAAEEGSVRFEVEEPDEASVDALMDRFVRLEAAGWKSRAGTAIVKVPALERFYRGYARAAAREGRLRLFFLSIGSATVAGRVAVDFADRLWEIKIGYDETWRRFAPGILLTHKTLEYAARAGFQGYEYLGSAEPWQRRWPVNVRDHQTLRFYPHGVRGGFALLTDSFGFVKKALGRIGNGPFARPAAAETG